MREFQIGVIGSMADIELEDSIKNIAKEIGQEIALGGGVLLFGFEGDFDSLSEIAARSAEDAGGKTVAFVWGNRKQKLPSLNSLQIITGQDRGGGREFSLILSSDAVISIGGGSGTLMEMAIAYQANIPIVALKNTHGWSEKLSGEFMDNRKRLMVISAITSKEAVELASKAIFF